MREKQEFRRETGVYMSPTCRVTRTTIWGEPVFFTITNPRDVIQRHHAGGEFYELEELEIIRRACPFGATFVDIGANIGNHSLFATKFLRVRKVIPFEPNPVAIEILRCNLELNGVTGLCDLSHLGKGLADQSMAGLSIDAPARNLGGGRMVEGGGSLEVIRGDEALAGEEVDFIKIDVEGMEMKVLSGLQETIRRCRPRLFVEVDRSNRDALRAWLGAAGYRVAARFRRYRANENFLLEPAAPPVEVAKSEG